MMRYYTIALLLLTFPLTAAAKLIILGKAMDADDNLLLYTEEHLITESRHDVSYRFPDGALLADKNIHYQRGYQTPVFQLYDHRFGRTSGSRWENGEWIVWQEETSGKRDEETLDADDALVIDAGFNYFVLENFEVLSSGQSLQFTFGITDPPMGIDMLIEKQDCAAPIYSLEVKPTLCLKAVSRSALLRWFVEEIYLAYYTSTQASTPLLALYQGPSNLPGTDDKGQSVRILYRYEITSHP